MAKPQRSRTSKRPVGSKVVPGDPTVRIVTSNLRFDDLERLTRLQGRLTAETGRRISQWDALHAALSLAFDLDALLVAARLPGESKPP